MVERITIKFIPIIAITALGLTACASQSTAQSTNTDIPPTVKSALTNTPEPPTDIPTSTPRLTSTPIVQGAQVVIINVDKRAEYVDIKNNGTQSQNLNGWELVSERGNQRCRLGGTIEPGETLRIWAMTGEGGFRCNYNTNIWNNSESDPAVLYDNNGQEVDRY